jgi:hypothetical protein
MTQNWALKHGFLHACRHRPHAITASHERQLAPNHGLAAVALMLVLAFVLCAALTLCHSKLVRRHHLSGIEVVRPLRASLFKPPPRIRAPYSPAPPQRQSEQGRFP